MNKQELDGLTFPLCNIQGAYFVGEQSTLPLPTTARFYREVEIEFFELATVEQAWRQLVLRHAMLRAVVCDDGTQRILEQVEDYAIAFHDLRALEPEQRGARYDSIRQAMIGQVPPVQHWPQFCLEASTDGARLRLHMRFNLWMIDATSVQILMAELLELCRHPESSLPLVPATFEEYVAATVAARGSPSVARAKAYWHNRVATLPLGPALPLSCAPDDISSPVFVHRVHTLPAAMWRDLVGVAQQQKLTSNSAALAAFALVLARWSRHTHFTLTLLLSRRPFVDDDMADVVGNFGSTLLLEIQAGGDQSFAEFASSIQKQLWNDIRHLDYSGIDVGREMNRHRDTPLGLIAPIAFTSIQSGREGSIASQTVQQSIVQKHTHLDVPQVFLDHQLVEEALGQLTLNWDYVEGLLHPGVADDMFASYIDLLNALASDAAIWRRPLVAALPLPAAQLQMQEQYNRTAAPDPGSTLDQLFAEQLALRPEQTALIHGAVSLSYAELAARADALRRRFPADAGAAGHLIGVLLPKGWEQIVAVLAIARAGAAYVPIDPELPAARRQQLLEQAQLTLLVSSSVLAPELNLPASVRCVCIDGGDAHLAPLTVPRHRPSDVAYVIFTSGSTGVPKGVVIDHQGAVNTIVDLNRRLNIGPADRVLALSSLSFDLSVYDIFGLLASGGTVVLPTAAEQQSPEAWAGLIVRHGISIWNSVPALFQLLTDACRQDELTLPGLRHVLMSGDWIPRALPEQGRAVATGARIFSLGGATEASIWSVIHEIGALDQSWRTIPYGRPLANQQLHVLDDTLAPCPWWKSGELYIGGRGLALSYLHDAHRTAERFITHPRTGERLYRTGDMARMRPDGNMEFLGREDHQIKLRGFRIELGEIESFILQQGAVSAAVVKVVGQDQASKRLAAFVATRAGASLTADALREHLGTVLPRYMVPELIHVMAALPLTANGKVDHQRLDSLCASVAGGGNQAAPDGAAALPQDSLLAALRLVWQELLALDDIDPDASFFALGGTSFQVLQLLAKIRKRFGLRLGMGDISSSLSLRAMAAQLRSAGAARDSDAAVLVPLRAGQSAAGPAVFCIHPVGGSAHCYMSLAAQLAPEARVYGLQAAPVAAGAVVSIEQLALRYTELIEQADPTGPYLLVGWSMGAAVTAEIARLLRAGKKQLVFIGLLDPYCAADGAHAIPALDILFAFGDDLAGLAGRRFVRPDTAELAVLAALPADSRFARLMDELVRQEVIPAGGPVVELEDIFNIFESNTRALLAYTPTFLDGEVTVFYANTDVYAGDRYLQPWRARATTLHEHRCAADHFTLMQAPAILSVAAAINAQLADSRAAGVTTVDEVTS